VTIATEQRLPAATWSVDAVHSTIGFSIKYLVSSFRTEFDRYDATLDTSGATPHLTGTVDPTSIRVKDENFHAHLQSPEFFDSARYPELRFESTGFRVEGDAVVVDGELTIKGHTAPVEGRGTLTAVETDPFGNDRVGVQLETVVDRRAFGLDWNAPLPKGGLALADETKLVINLYFVKA
jgi:polyisoprenoid-binding protein YceI